MYNDVIENLEIMINDNNTVIDYSSFDLDTFSKELAKSFHLKYVHKVGDVVLYVSTTNVGNHFFETMVFNTSLKPNDKCDNINKYIDWNSQYGVYRTDTIDEATEKHANVIAMLVELDRRLSCNRVEVKKSLTSNMLSVINKIFKK